MERARDEHPFRQLPVEILLALRAQRRGVELHGSTSLVQRVYSPAPREYVRVREVFLVQIERVAQRPAVAHGPERPAIRHRVLRVLRLELLRAHEPRDEGTRTVVAEFEPAHVPVAVEHVRVRLPAALEESRAVAVEHAAEELGRDRAFYRRRRDEFVVFARRGRVRVRPVRVRVHAVPVRARVVQEGVVRGDRAAASAPSERSRAVRGGGGGGGRRGRRGRRRGRRRRRRRVGRGRRGDATRRRRRERRRRRRDRAEERRGEGHRAARSAVAGSEKSLLSSSNCWHWLTMTMP